MICETRATLSMTALFLAVSWAGCKDKGEGEGVDTMSETAKNEKQTGGDPGAEERKNLAPEPGDPAAGKTIEAKEVTYQAGDATLQGYLAYDASKEGKRPGVLVVHEWWGHTDYVRKRARQLAEMGYTALALDMYGKGKQAKHPDQAKAFMQEVMKDKDAAKERFLAAKKLLEEHETTNPEKIAAIGYCFGGGVVLNMARAGVDLDAVASFHGTLGTDQPAGKGDIAAEVMVAHGEADPLVPPEQVEAFKKEMEQAGVDLQFYGYQGAEHAFTNPAATAMGEKFDMPLAYDEEAAKDSWQKLEAFLKSAFAGG